MKLKEFIEVLEKSTFICDCITDNNIKTLEEEKFELTDVGIAQNGWAGNGFDNCFKVQIGENEIRKYNSITKLKQDVQVMNMVIIKTEIALSQYREICKKIYETYNNYYNNSTFKFFVKKEGEIINEI